MLVRILWIGVVAASLAGCESQSKTTVNSNPSPQINVPVPPPPPGSTPPAQPSPAADDLPPGVIRAEDATGVWNKSQVEQYLKENVPLTEVSLSETTPDNYRGTGRNAEGANFELTIGQVPGGIACKYTTDRGGSGGLSFGNKVPGFE